MNKLICIVGPTGTGKTKKAIELSQQEPSILISADSRQVYRSMDIVTGKDHPKHINMIGLDLIDPDQSISVAVWHDAVIPHINQAWRDGRQVIVVGGTGLYVKAITHGIETMHVPVNQVLRDQLATYPTSELQAKLNNLNPAKYASMNSSDRVNPRRLIRAIEITMSSATSQRSQTPHRDLYMLGLKYSDESIQRNKILARVKQRLKMGAVSETIALLKRYNRHLQSMSALGYKSIIQYIDNQIDEENMINSWVADEIAYTKRQMTWFRKQPVIWYDV